MLWYRGRGQIDYQISQPAFWKCTVPAETRSAPEYHYDGAIFFYSGGLLYSLKHIIIVVY